ncbi:MAG: GntR family transcriptional regulator [Armatimonadetes bacterium]|nr:GntR family transcriptional regulator [Armatimonadota bacterium]
MIYSAPVEMAPPSGERAPAPPAAAGAAFKSVNQYVTDHLREELFSGQLREGQFLRQQVLAQRFGVSEVVVREALRRLEGEGLVETRPRKGARATFLSVEELHELYELRILLEDLLTRHAVTQATAADLREATMFHDRMKREPDTIAWLALNRGFHDALYGPSGKTKLMKFADYLRASMERYLRMSLTVLNGSGIAHREHAAILAAYRRKDPHLAAKRVAAHLRRTERTVSEFLAKQLRTPPAP